MYLQPLAGDDRLLLTLESKFVSGAFSINLCATKDSTSLVDLQQKCFHRLEYNVLAALMAYDAIVPSLPNEWRVIFVCGTKSQSARHSGVTLMRALHAVITASMGSNGVQEQLTAFGYDNFSRKEVASLQKIAEQSFDGRNKTFTSEP